jgi:hypothetical protein
MAFGVIKEVLGFRRFSLRGHRPGVGAGLDRGAGLGELRLARLAAGDFGGDGEPVVQRRGVGLVGFGEQFGHFEVELAQRRAGAAVARGGVLARVGQDFRAVDRHRDARDLQHAAVRRQLQHPHEGRGEQRGVLPAERAEGVVVGVRIGAEDAHRHAVVGRAFNLPAGKNARRITVNQQGEEQRRRVLRAAAAALVDPRRAQVELCHRLQHEMHEVVLRHPLAHVRRQEQRGVPVDVHEFGGHARLTARRAKRSARTAGKPDRLLGEPDGALTCATLRELSPVPTQYESTLCQRR